jgi:hypothetical protein
MTWRESTQTPGQLTGYAVGRQGDLDAGGRQVWFSGSKLAPDRSLPKLTARWAEVTPGRLPRRPARRSTQQRRATLERIGRTVARAADGPPSPATGIATGEVATTLARGVEGATGGPLTDVADRLAQAVRQPHGRRPGLAFHRTLRAAEAARPASTTLRHTIIGTEQPTWTTATIHTHATLPRVVPLTAYGPDQLFGDGTVPLVAATPAGVELTSNTLRRVADKHGNLQRNTAALAEITALLTTPALTPKGPAHPIAPHVEVPELTLAGDPVTVEITLPPGERHGLKVTLTDEAGKPQTRTPKLLDGIAASNTPICPPAPTPSTSPASPRPHPSPPSAATCSSGQFTPDDGTLAAGTPRVPSSLAHGRFRSGRRRLVGFHHLTP